MTTYDKICEAILFAENSMMIAEKRANDHEISYEHLPLMDKGIKNRCISKIRYILSHNTQEEAE